MKNKASVKIANKTFLFVLQPYERHEVPTPKLEIVRAPTLRQAFLKSKSGQQVIKESNVFEDEDNEQHIKTDKAVKDFVNDIDVGGWSSLVVYSITGSRKRLLCGCE